MQALLEVVLPVFVILGFGYAAVWRGWFADSGVSALMVYTQTFAIPCLLFRAIADLDLGQAFDARLLLPFYVGALTCFFLGVAAARAIFRRPWPDAVAIGFCCLFSNSVLLGLPITEQAYGTDALAGNYAIIALHAPVCYAVGLTAMEIVRAGGAGMRAAMRSILHAVFRNALVIGIVAGFAVNLSAVELPASIESAVDLMARSALPAALFGLGGVLYRYRPEGDAATIAFVCVVSLIVHPAIVLGLATAMGLGLDGMRSAVLTAAMAPGVNSYIFANLYGVARRVAASSVLVATAGSGHGWRSSPERPDQPANAAPLFRLGGPLRTRRGAGPQATFGRGRACGRSTGAAGSETGSVTRKVLPLPSTLSAVIRPPIASQILLVTARARPVPP